MTKKTIYNWFIAAIIYFALLIIVGIALSIVDQSDKRILFSTFKDLMPLFISIPAAWLGYCAQRRSAYLQQLRSLWSKLIDTIQSAIQYTHTECPSQAEYLSILVKLSSAIDEVRGLFCNIGETDNKIGLYPFEPLKDIYGLIEKLYYGDKFSSKEAIEARKKVFALWKDVRQELLKEFDREEPTFPHSHWADLEKCRVYEEHNIPKTPT